MKKRDAACTKSKSVTAKELLQLIFVPLVLALILAQTGLWGAPQSDKSLAQQIFDVMVQLPGNKPGNRLVHAKGIVCEGTFTATAEAATISRAAQFRGGKVPLTIRFSDAAPDPAIPDSSGDAFPHGMAVRFTPAGGGKTDIVIFSHNGFVVATGEEFLALQKSVLATDPSKPHPWPVEIFLSSHPAAMKFVTDPKPMPTSYGTEAYYSNNAFVFVNKKGVKQAGRYQILPVAGQHYMDDAAAKAASPNVLSDELRARLAKEPVKFRVVLQLPGAGDPTNDSTVVWAADRKTVELGTITITGVVADSDAAQKTLAFDPTRLADGIELSDDPLPALRSGVYMLSAMHRQEK
jgi:catalase